MRIKRFTKKYIMICIRSIKRIYSFLISEIVSKISGVGNRRLNNSNTKNLEAYIPVPSNGSSIHTLKKLLIFTEYLRLRCFQPLLS